MNPRPNIGPMLAQAIKACDLPRIGSLCDHARACGMTYSEVAAIACMVAGIDAAEWEALLYDVDSHEGAP